MISVKASFEGELCQFSIERPFAYEQLREKIGAAFGLKEPVQVRYLDDEGDYVNLSSEAEMEEALCVSERVADEAGIVLQLQVISQVKPRGEELVAQDGQDNSLDCANFKEHKEHLKMHRRRARKQLKQQIKAERCAFKVHLCEKQLNLNQEKKHLHIGGKGKRKEIKKLKIKELKQQFKSEKMADRHHFKHLKHQFRNQHKLGLRKMKIQQMMLFLNLSAPNALVESANERNEPMQQDNQTENGANPSINNHIFPLTDDVHLLKKMQKHLKKQCRSEAKAQKKARKREDLLVDQMVD